MKISPNTENLTSLCPSITRNAGLGIFCGILMLSLAGCSADSAPEPQVQAAPAAEVSESTAVTAPAPEVDRSKLPTVAILATGGTIAGTGDVGRATNYKPGQLNIEDLVRAAGLYEVANIKGEQICNINSDDITAEIWLKLARRINELAGDPKISGIVITHGTDTMDETAYFLNLVVKTKKPVVITGSMRPSTANSADGPMNLHQAVALAASREARGKGVMVMFSDRIYGARDVRKVNTFGVNAFSSGEYGCMGYVIDDNVTFYDLPSRQHTTDTEFSASSLKTLPKVAVAYFNVDSPGSILDYYASQGYRGVVIAGAGNGEYSVDWKDAVKRHQDDLVVVRSSRVGTGLVTPSDEYDLSNVVRADDLQPQKAAVLLRLALSKTSDRGKIARMYSVY